MRVISVGEVLVELSRGLDGRFGFGFGGDTFRAAVYLSRAGAPVAFATALGADIYSEAAVATAAAEGIATDLILRIPDRLPGVYLLEPADGRRPRCEFWREAAPARQLFELPGWDRIAEELVAADLIYVSGITLSLYSNVGLGRLLAALEFARERGARVTFDTKWRPRGWRGDDQRARAVYAEALKRTDIALPSFADEAQLWGDATPAAAIERLTTFGVREIAIKNGAHPALVHADGQPMEVSVPEIVAENGAVGASDAFNAAYLAARLRQESPEEAALAGHRLAAEACDIPRRSCLHRASRPANAGTDPKRRSGCAEGAG